MFYDPATYSCPGSDSDRTSFQVALTAGTVVAGLILVITVTTITVVTVSLVVCLKTRKQSNRVDRSDSLATNQDYERAAPQNRVTYYVEGSAYDYPAHTVGHLTNAIEVRQNDAYSMSSIMHIK